MIIYKNRSIISLLFNEASFKKVFEKHNLLFWSFSRYINCHVEHDDGHEAAPVSVLSVHTPVTSSSEN